MLLAMSGRLPIPARAVLSAAITVAAFGACEMALRFVQPGWSGLYVGDPHSHWTLRTGMNEATVPHAEEGSTFSVKTNALGLRDGALPNEKPWVLALGCSTTFGWGVDAEAAWPEQLEQLLGVEVINAGVPGYGPDKQLLLLRETIGTWSPDLVVLAFFWNDLFDARQAEYNRPVLRDGKVHFVPPEPASPEHPAFRVFNARKEKRARRYAIVPVESRLYRFVSDRTKLLRYAIQARLGGEERRALPRAFAPGEEDAAWPLCYALLREIAQVARTGGARFALLVVPDQVQVEPDVSVYAIPDALWKVQERIAAFAAREGIALIDPLDAMRARRQRDGRPLYHRRDRHLNPEGHRHMGELLLAGLRRQALLDEGV